MHVLPLLTLVYRLRDQRCELVVYECQDADVMFQRNVDMETERLMIAVNVCVCVCVCVCVRVCVHARVCKAVIHWSIINIAAHLSDVSIMQLSICARVTPA